MSINFSNVNPGIDADANEAKNDENEEEADKDNAKNNNATLDDEDGGIIMNDIPIGYDKSNIPITVGNFRIGGRNAVFGFYRQLDWPFKQGKKNLGIMCVLSAKALDYTNYDKWTWVKCARVITKNTTNLLYHLENKHAGISSVKALVSNKKKKRSMESGPATVHSIGSSPNTCVNSSIAVTMKFSVELVKCDVFFWLVGSGTLFGKTL